MVKESPPLHLIEINAETLRRQSRSFAIPIIQLSPHLKIPIMVQYNLNKTIDTVEDHKNLSVRKKKELIHAICEALAEGCVSARARHIMLSQTPDEEAFVFKNYAETIHLFNHMPEFEKSIGLKWTQTMASGMIKYLEQPIQTLEDLNDYCYFVAGTVGIYLTDLVSHQHKEKPDKISEIHSHAMGFGRFLQKLNILRDYIEDKERLHGSYWPKNLINRYENPIDVLNFLCHDTLTNDAGHALQYYQMIQSNDESFDFFIRFILYSGLEYIKLIKNNKNIFSKMKVKLPKTMITGLFSQMKRLSSHDFFDKCTSILEKEIETYESLLCTTSNRQQTL